MRTSLVRFIVGPKEKLHLHEMITLNSEREYERCTGCLLELIHSAGNGGFEFVSTRLTSRETKWAVTAESDD